MAKKLTKAAARKRVKEAEAKLMAVAVSHPQALPFKTMDTLIQHMNRIKNKLM